MWISRKEYRDLLEQVCIANIVLETVKAREDQMKELQEECDRLKASRSSSD